MDGSMDGRMDMDTPEFQSIRSLPGNDLKTEHQYSVTTSVTWIILNILTNKLFSDQVIFVYVSDSNKHKQRIYILIITQMNIMNNV